jgi:hypothetical protein
MQVGALNPDPEAGQSLDCFALTLTLLPCASATETVPGSVKAPISNAIAASAAIATYVFVFMCFYWATHIIFLSCVGRFCHMM